MPDHSIAAVREIKSSLWATAGGKEPNIRPKTMCSQAAEAVAVDDRGIAVLHRHQSAAGGVFVLSSLQVEVAAGMPAAETKAWFAGLLSLCQATNSTRASESGSDRLVSAIVTPI